MRRLIFIAAMSALVLAKPKPETYKETEDFQYSRSSTDEGHKSGYYGAQRGNMGGNYERAHNMDNVAQNQMSGLVRTVEGELGDGANTRTGSVYTAANSRGIYGSGNYDLSNLKGRNFAEGESLGSTQSHSSLTSQNSGHRGYSYSGMNSAGFSSSNHAQDSRYSGHQSSGYADQRQIDNLQALDRSQGHRRYENDNQAGYNMNQHIQYGSQGRSEFEQSSSNQYGSSGFNGNSQSRYITTPVRVVLRPGGRVAIPIAAPTYDISQSSLSQDKNTINSEAEILNQQSSSKPTNKVKHYESSYSYRKEWEKHHTIPGNAEVSVVVPTENPFPKNSELYEDAQLLQSSKDQLASASLQNAHASNVNSEHRAHTKSAASSRSRFQSGYNTQQSQSGFNSQQSQSGFNSQHSSAASDNYANAYGQGAQHSGMSADLTNVDLKPKSYQSSYSYHKSWERQGDPYVIQPVGGVSNGQASQRLTAGSSNSAAYSSHRHGSHSRQAQQSYYADSDCDEEGHVRVARSYNIEQEQQHQSQWQQAQSAYENLQDLGQQTQSKWENLEDLGQQQQNKWDNLQDLGQQTQNQWDNLQQLGQQTQNQWDNLQQLGQQTQDKWDKLEDLGQQTQRDLEQAQNGNLEDFSQQNQKEDTLTNFEQQGNGEDIPKKITQQETQPISNNWEQTADFESQSNTANIENIKQQTQSVNKQGHHIEGFDQNQQNNWFHSQDKNTNNDNFMRPITGPNAHKPENNPLNTNENPNLFPLNPWTPKIDQGYSWNFNHNHNPYHNGNHYWHTDEHHNKYEHHNQYEHNFHSNHFSTSNTDTSLQGIWDKIDNIAGEAGHSVTHSETDDKFSHDYSNFHSYNQNADHMQHGFSWGYIPAYPNFEIPQVNTDKVKEENGSEKHYLFEEEIQSTSSTVKPKEILSSNPNLVENVDTHKPLVGEGNAHSQDEGRGDIGPEETSVEYTTDKQNKSPEVINSSSITKENHTIKPDDTIIELNSLKDKKEDAVLYSSVTLAIPTSTSSTTIKSDVFYGGYTKPNMDAQASPNKYGVENEDIPPNIQQQNLEQQLVDSFSQQTQGSWFDNNLHQGYDQQNTEQQFEILHQPEQDKLFKSPEEIESLSLTQEDNSTKVNDNQPNLIKNINKETTLQPSNPITTPSTPTSTTVKANNLYSVNPIQSKPNTDDVDLYNKPLSNVQNYTNPPKPGIQSEYIPSQPQNFEQQFSNDFGQHMQSSSFSDNLQQGYDQQNVEQQQFEVIHQQVNSKPFKSPKEIGTSSLTKEVDKDINDFNSRPRLNNNIQGQSRTLEETAKDTSLETYNPKPQEKTTERVETPEGIQQQLGQEFVNLDQQVQSSWFGDNLQQGYDQQNMEQQFEPFQQHEDMEQMSLQDFGQQAQSSSQTFENLQQTENKDTQSFVNNFEQISPPSQNSRHINEDPKHSSYIDNKQENSNNKNLQNVQKTDDTKPSVDKISEPVPSPVETSSEEPGFWKSVGNKFSNAKNKVFSWFKGS